MAAVDQAREKWWAKYLEYVGGDNYPTSRGPLPFEDWLIEQLEKQQQTGGAP